MKNLFLASYFSKVANLLPDFAGDCIRKKVAFIPTASLPEKMAFYVRADKKALQKIGLIVEELEITKRTKEEIEQIISNTDFIFVSGGNTFFLLQELKRNGADKILIDHINKGKLYIGSSAGSVILSRNIEYIGKMDSIKKAPNLNNDFTALSLIDFCIVPHFNNFPFRKAAKNTVKEFSDILDIRPISNNQAIIVNGARVETLTKTK